MVVLLFPQANLSSAEYARKVRRMCSLLTCSLVLPYLLQAYKEVPKLCQYCQLRQIRGDNYCAIRGAVFQCLINNLPPFNSSSSKECILQKLSQAFSDPSSGLKHWTFAKRLSFTRKTLLKVMRRCIDSIYSKVSLVFLL